MGREQPRPEPEPDYQREDFLRDLKKASGLERDLAERSPRES
jgi:hypothetical protein